MKVYTTRSGVVLHGSPNCPDLIRRKVFTILEEDALPRAVKCTHALCFAAFVRKTESEAKAA